MPDSSTSAASVAAMLQARAISSLSSIKLSGVTLLALDITDPQQIKSAVNELWRLVASLLTKLLNAYKSSKLDRLKPARLAQQESNHPLYCVDKGFTFALAFALCANCAHFVAA